MFTQLSGSFDIPVFWSRWEVFCLFVVVIFFNEDIFSICAWAIECREGGEGEEWWEEVSFKMQSSFRPKPTWLRIKTVFICYLLKAFLVCISGWCSQTSLLLPVLYLPTDFIFFLRHTQEAKKHRGGDVAASKKLLERCQVTFTHFHAVTSDSYEFLSGAFSSGVNWTLET